MRFDEPDTRQAYRQGARDLYECIAAGLEQDEQRLIQAWLGELETWQDFDPPHPPAAILR